MNTSKLLVVAASSIFFFAQAGAQDVASKNDAQMAAEYRQEATALIQKAALHRRRGEQYRHRGPGQDGAGIASHCESLASNYEKAAKDANAIASALSK